MNLDLEKYFQKYKNSLIVALCVILVLPIGYGIYQSIASQKKAKYGDQVYEFSKKEFVELKDNKLKPADFLAKFKVLLEKTSNFDGCFVPLMETSAIFIEKNELAFAQQLLELAQRKFTGQYQKILIGLQLATVYEDLSLNDKAINVLEELANSKLKILEGKVHLDLGRLYRKVNNTAKAKEKFQYVLNNFDEEVYKKLAHINLLK